MERLQGRSYFEPKAQEVLDKLMEWPLRSPELQARFEHLGSKGGSTAFVLTETFYARERGGPLTELAVFFGDLRLDEQQRLQAALGAFEAAVLDDADFRRRLGERFLAEAASVRILYGGSVKAENAGQLLTVANVNGALVGGASLKSADFLGIAGIYR